MGTRYGRGTLYYPLDARSMALTCRKLARDLRAEAAAGADYGPIHLSRHSNQWEQLLISRAGAAASMDQQAARWEAEANGGARNSQDRVRIGFPP
jgi:hypothetical protein